MEIQTERCVLRAWKSDDVSSLVRIANNRKVWRNLTHLFPTPFEMKDAEQWLEFMGTVPEKTHFAIDVNGQLVGAIGAMIGQGIFAKTAEFGYWLGEAWWGRGIATSASMNFSRFVMDHFALNRMQAYVFDWNSASMRVLEKSGFVREAVLERSAVKDGQVVNEHLFALTDKRLRAVRSRTQLDFDSQRNSMDLSAVAVASSG